MNSIVNLIRSSIGRKFLMAITGLILVGFVTGHLVGNLQIFLHPDHINGYAHFLQGLGPALWLVRLVLLACTVIHVWAAVTLTIESRLARGPEKYGVSKWLNATIASRYMRMTGVVVAAFIVYHIAHFTIGVAQHSTFKAELPKWTMLEDAREFGVPLAAKGDVVDDVYSMVYLGFANPVVSLF
jgi:succinate dehydrogenase / fumarate reductase cytochrome b subunit